MNTESGTGESALHVKLVRFARGTTLSAKCAFASERRKTPDCFVVYSVGETIRLMYERSLVRFLSIYIYIYIYIYLHSSWKQFVTSFEGKEMGFSYGFKS